jgi:phosphatidylglycerol:prolipoprotein diacylglycerol transferase
MKHIEFPGLGLEFDINRTALSLPGGIRIYWYGIIIGLGMVLAALIVYHEMKKSGRKADLLFDFLIVTIPLSIIGARIYYVIFSWDSYRENLKEIFAIWNGGLAIYGGVITGAICTIVFTRLKKLPALWFFDLASIGCILAQSIGRWGNFVNAEAYGGECNLPWRMVIGNSSVGVHPTFFYESVWNLVGFLISYLLIYKRKHEDGECISFYMIWYGLGRFFIEALRSDSLYIGSLKVSQIVALLSVIFGAALLIFVKNKAKKRKNSEN